jgi:pimeloyl-ACP methyl ester carboxylesterase
MIHFDDPAPGNLPPVLLLHGLGVDRNSWYFQREALVESGYRPILIDVPGFGQSSWEKGRWSLEQCSTAIIHFLDDIGVRKTAVIGISMGGVLAEYLASIHPDYWTRIILINSYARLVPVNLSGVTYFSKRLWRLLFMGFDQQVEFVAEKLFPDKIDAEWRRRFCEQVHMADRRIYKESLIALGTCDLRSTIRLIKAPTLLITAEEDGTIDPIIQEEILKYIPNCRQIRVANAGHAVIVQKPVEVNQAILEFLNQPM